MEAFRPIYWEQGMFLQPQHFQQQDRYHEVRLWRHLQLLSPYCWGVKSLAINQDALQNFQFIVTECELVVQDGVLIRYRGNASQSNACIEPCSFDHALKAHLASPARGEPFGVYLGVKHFQPEEANVAFGSMNGNRVASAQESRRFRVDEVPTPDLFLKSPQRPDLQYLLYEVRVFFEGDPAVGYECVRVAELAIDTRGQCTGLTPDYIFPCVSVSASRELGDWLSGIRNILEAKARLLWERAQEYGLSTLDPLTLGTMQTVNRYTSLFQHYLEVPETHPYVFYGLLRQCVSELSTFFEASPLLGGTFPPYRHEDLRESFRRLVEAARQLLERLSKGPETMVPLHYDAGLKLFTADLNAMFTDRQYRHFLAVKTDMPLGDLDRFLMRTGKICSREDVDELKRRNLPGLSVRYQETLPEGLAPRTGFRYFELLIHDRDNIWSKIEQRRNIAVACQLTSQDAEMQLWVLTGS